jgi:hypothetical protein
VIVLGVLALMTIRVPGPIPSPATISVRWAAGVGTEDRQVREAALRLERIAANGDRSWVYRLRDSSAANIRALVTDPMVEDTDGVDRSEFRVVSPSVTLAERVTARFPALERATGPGFRGWLAAAHAWPAMLCAVWLLALSRPGVRVFLFRGVPVLSSAGLGLFRVALGLALLVILPAATRVPAAPLPASLHRAAGWFADWGWVHWLALNPGANSAALALALIAVGLFAAGVVPRVAFAVGVAAITARVFVVLMHRSAHDLGLPLVALWGLLFVRWDASALRLASARHSSDDAAGHGFALWWPGAVLGIGLLAAAYAKFDTSGWDWIAQGAVRYHFIEDFQQAPTGWGLWIASHPAWAVAASFAAIAVECAVVVHVFFPQPTIRLAFGAIALALLAGLYVMQGVFWPAWWLLLLAFIPWDALAVRIPARVATLPLRALPLAAAQVALVGVVVCVQIFASSRRVEVEPFVSDYGMYSWTWPSTAAFDQHLAAKYRVYRYEIDETGQRADVTSRLQSLPGAADALTAAIDRFRAGEAMSDGDRTALRAVRAAYVEKYAAAPDRLMVLLDEQAFDWAHARFYQKREGELVGIVDLSEGVVRSAARISASR